ncbi:hypothetical protein FC1_21340 [Flavobacterium columnare NBRC 100251 = ATCC 23463]|nr:hypothetical protein FC1_21340 [Flavobacterium columnare NBRC 100251 = ATCC 23463]
MEYENNEVNVTKIKTVILSFMKSRLFLETKVKFKKNKINFFLKSHQITTLFIFFLENTTSCDYTILTLNNLPKQ